VLLVEGTAGVYRRRVLQHATILPHVGDHAHCVLLARGRERADRACFPVCRVALTCPTASGSRGDGEPHEPSGGHAGS